jgi:hypothetical protein
MGCLDAKSSGVSGCICASSVLFSEPLLASSKTAVRNIGASSISLADSLSAKCLWVHGNDADSYFGVSVISHSVSKDFAVTCGLVCSVETDLVHEWFLVEGDFLIFSDGLKFRVKRDGV